MYVRYSVIAIRFQADHCDKFTMMVYVNLKICLLFLISGSLDWGNALGYFCLCREITSIFLIKLYEKQSNVYMYSIASLPYVFKHEYFTIVSLFL